MTYVFIAAAWLAGIYTPRVYNSVKASVLASLERYIK